MRQPDLLRSTAVVSAAAALSRVLGFVRDVLVAALLGTGPVADAFLVAFRIPGLVRRVVGEGALNAGYVPVAGRVLREQGEEAARLFAGEALSGLAVLVVAATAVLELMAGGLVLAFAAGFAGDAERFGLATDFTRLMLPLMPATLLAALVSAQLNAQGRVVAAAVAPLAVNLVLVGVLALLAATDLPAERRGLLLAAAVSLGGIVQLVVLLPALARLPVPPRLVWPRLSPEVRRMLALGVPGLVVLAASQLAVVAAMQVASASPAAVARLYYADRLFQLPLGFVAAAAGVVLLPELARLLREGRAEAANEAIGQSLVAALLLALPAAAGLVVLSGPIASVLFERGAFHAEDARETGRALAVLAAGLPAAALSRVLSQAWFAREELRVPLWTAMAGVAAAGAAALLLAPHFGVAGIAAGVSLGAWLQGAFVTAGALGLGYWRPAGRDLRRLAGAGAAALVMGASVAVLAEQAGAWLAPGASLLWRAPALSALCAAGIAAYAGAGFFVGVFTLDDLRLRR